MPNFLVEVPSKLAIVPPDKAGQYLVYSNYYWTIRPETDSLLFFINSFKEGYYRDLNDFRPQANAGKEITERLTKKMYPDCVVSKFPVVFLTKNMFDSALWRKL